ncbi:MAG: metal-dependent transcriptional regulator [Chloroflexi bacterium]|nr:metal-dependent transcriptional regulator [Chloroflexota bacterium]
MPNAPSHEIPEMILLTLARAEENAQMLTLADLARTVNLSAASLDAHLHPLFAQALVTHTTSAVTLTVIGQARARILLRRHRLVERHFTDVLGLDWARAHDEADRLEHFVSPETEAQLADQLGNPDTCPHGNPIPRASSDAAKSAQKLLADCAPRTRATIARIALETSATLRHLATLGLLPNVQVVVENRAPFGGPVLVRVGHAHYALGRDLANRIWVTPT